MSVILLEAGATARKLDVKPLADEKLLQKYIVEDPSCLPVEQIDEELRLVVIAKEFPAGNGFIDALAVDQAGALYIIETKLYRGTDKRRVLAQVLECGAGLWMDYRHRSDFLVKLEGNAARALQCGARQSIEKKFELNREETDRLLTTAAQTIIDGRFNFIVLMDHIDDHLKNLITFVNANTVFTMYGVDLEVYGIDEESTLAIPRLYGAETPRNTARESGGPITDDAFFEQATNTVSPEIVTALRALYQSSIDEADVVKWGRGATGSFNPKFSAVSSKSLYTVYSDGRLYVNFGWLGRTESGRMAIDILAKGLRSIGFELPSDFRERFLRIDAAWWVPRVDELKKVFRSAGAIVPK
jgi:hypothetical protein